MSVEWIEYKGKSILYADCRGMSPERLTQNLDNIFKAIWESKDDMVILVNHEKVTISTAFLGKVKELTKQSRQESEEKGHFKVKKIALVGVKGVGSFLLYSYNLATGQNIVDFKTEEEAKVWLIQ